MYSLLEYRRRFLDNYHQIVEWKQKDRSINKNSSLYIERLHDQSFYDQSIYIKYDDMINGIKELILKLDRNQPFCLFFPLSYSDCFKIGSENSIILECWDQLSLLNIVEVLYCANDLCQVADTNILVLDDCIYTGKKTKHLIDSFEMMRDDPLLAKSREFSLYFTIVVYASNPVIERNINDHVAKHKRVNISFYNSFDYERVADILFKILISTCTTLLNKEEIERIYKHAKTMVDDGKTIINDNDLPLLYFDHKIHNSLVKIYDPKLFNQGCCPERLPPTIVEEIYNDIDLNDDFEVIYTCVHCKITIPNNHRLNHPSIQAPISLFQSKADFYVENKLQTVILPNNPVNGYYCPSCFFIVSQ